MAYGLRPASFTALLIAAAYHSLSLQLCSAAAAADGAALSDRAAEHLLSETSSTTPSTTPASEAAMGLADESVVIKDFASNSNETTWAISQTAHRGGVLQMVMHQQDGATDEAEAKYFRLTLRGLQQSSIIGLSHQLGVEHESIDDRSFMNGRIVPQTVLSMLPRFALLTFSADTNYEKDLADAAVNPHVVDNTLLSLELLEVTAFFKDTGDGATVVYNVKIVKGHDILGADIVLSTRNGSIATETSGIHALDFVEFQSAILLVDCFTEFSIAQQQANGFSNTKQQMPIWKPLRSLKGNIAANYIRNVAELSSSSPAEDDAVFDAVVKAQGWSTLWVPLYGVSTIALCCTPALQVWNVFATLGITLPAYLVALWCCIV